MPCRYILPSLDVCTRMEVEWDDRNLRHLLAENGHRGIGPDEVEQVLANPTSERRRLVGGRRKDRGHTKAGRRLVVIVDVPSPQRLRPRTAWEDRG